MAKNNIKKVMIQNVTLLHPKLDSTYRYIPSQKRSEKCPPTAPTAAWKISWQMAEAEARSLHAELKAHYEQNPVEKQPFNTVFGMRKNEDGTYKFTAKRNGCKASTGEPNKPPQVIGPDKLALENLAIWSGSKGSIRCWAAPTRSPQDNVCGITLYFDTVQVTEPIYGSGGLDDFEQLAPPPPTARQSVPQASDDFADAEAKAQEEHEDDPF